jgi:hypothetical protein
MSSASVASSLRNTTWSDAFSRVAPILLILFACASVAIPAHADPLTATWQVNNGTTIFNYSASVEESGANYLITFTATNNGTVNGYFRGFGLKGLFDDPLTLITFTQGGTALGAASFNAFVDVKTSQTDPCKTGGGGDPVDMCAELSVAGNHLVGLGQNLIFTFLVSGGGDPNDDTWHLQTKVFSWATGNGGIGLSEDANVTEVPPPPIPEPASIALIGGGLAMVARKLRKARRA